MAGSTPAKVILSDIPDGTGEFRWPDNMSPALAAEYVNLSPSLLAKMRMKSDPRTGPPFVKIGKSVIYRKADLDAWLQANLVEGSRKDHEARNHA